jgi:hypothetical protein
MRKEGDPSFKKDQEKSIDETQNHQIIQILLNIIQFLFIRYQVINFISTAHTQWNLVSVIERISVFII